MRALAVIPCVLGLCAPGCSTAPQPPRATTVEVGNQGDAREVVLAPGEHEMGPEMLRRDEALNCRDYGFVADAWPPPEQPTLDRARILFMPRRAHELLYFRSNREYRAGGINRWR